MKCQHSHRELLPRPLFGGILPHGGLTGCSEGSSARALRGMFLVLFFGLSFISCEAQPSEEVERPVLRWIEDATALIRGEKEDCGAMGVALLKAWFEARPKVLESLEQLRADPALRAALLVRHEERLSHSLLQALPAYRYCANSARFREQLRVGLELEALQNRDLNETGAGD